MRWTIPLLLCCAVAIMASLTSLASGPVPLSEDLEPTYVRFHTAYEGVGKYGGRFLKGEIAKVTKKIDAYYFEASTDLDSNYGQKARWDKVDVITREQAELDIKRRHEEWQAKKMATERRRMAEVILQSGLVDDANELRNLSNEELAKGHEIAKRVLDKQEAARRAQYPKTIFAGWDEYGQPITGTHTGGGNYFMGWDRNGQPRNGRAQNMGGGNYFLGFDENGQPITGR